VSWINTVGLSASPKARQYAHPIFADGCDKIVSEVTMPSNAIFYLLSFPRPTALAVVVLVASCVDFPYPAAAVAGLSGWQVSHVWL